MMFEAIFLVADNCTPIATRKKSLMNLQKRMALMKMKASLPATLPRNTHTKSRKLEKKRQDGSCLDRFQRHNWIWKKEEKKERKVSFSLGFFYRTILHRCWVCIQWCSCLEEEGFWVEGNTEIYIFNGLISPWREKWRAVKLPELKSSSVSKSLECCVASGDCQLPATSTPFVILFVWEQTVYHLIRFMLSRIVRKTLILVL